MPAVPAAIADSSPAQVSMVSERARRWQLALQRDGFPFPQHDLSRWCFAAAPGEHGSSPCYPSRSHTIAAAAPTLPFVAG